MSCFFFYHQPHCEIPHRCPHTHYSGALVKLTFGGDGTYRNASTEWEDVAYEPATLEIGMKEADFSNKNLGAGGAIIVGAWMSHKDNGAMTNLNISANKLTRGKWTNALGNGDPNDNNNYETDMSGLLQMRRRTAANTAWYRCYCLS